MHAFASTEPLEPAPGTRPSPSRLDTPLEVKPVRAAKAAEALGLETVGDLIEHFPREHTDRREARAIASLSEAEDVTVIAEVRRISSRRARGRLTIQTATVVDESGPMKAVWFNQPWLVDRLPAGTRVVLHGRYGGPRKGLAVKEHEVAAGATSTHSTGVVPVYRATDNLPSTKIRELVWNARDAIRHVVEPLPAWLRLAEKLPDRPAAVDAIHFPEDEREEPEARRRLAFEELFLLELALAARKRARQGELHAPAVEGTGDLVDPWVATLPFELTGDQRAACAAVDLDMRSERPMQRLLMGEVGSGKTVVALHAMLRAVEADRQAVLMAPTETLAEQHMATLDRLLGGHVPIELLTGSTPAGRRRELLGRLASGELSLLVGTHALIEPTVEFRDLALVVVDEQHRFGVRQRAALEAKAAEGMAPHALHMTATPIPRTLELTVYGDLDVTTLHELPSGRKPVSTHVGDTAAWRTRAYDRAREEIAAGRQVFVVCPLVEESEALQATAATKEAERLQNTEFRDHRVELIHGQMSSRDKQEAMRAFARGQADVLVATSVIEVGIDVPNATVMIIEAAERYGISQLHQLRGRIGRGAHASVCILFGDPALPRLQAIASERDGFRLAEVDLDIRGAGDVLGTRQHGLPQFRVARIPEDAELIERAKVRAEELLDRDPELASPEHALLRDAAAVMEPIPA
ncbi:MAG: ATP-dependent helicase RecG [Thermoleophilaceae bacterium]|nr:ATP-dependent helicase RecG [Thermoleophilaceae bacterium]